MQVMLLLHRPCLSSLSGLLRAAAGKCLGKTSPLRRHAEWRRRPQEMENLPPSSVRKGMSFTNIPTVTLSRLSLCSVLPLRFPPLDKQTFSIPSNLPKPTLMH